MTSINIIMSKDTDLYLTGWDIYAKLNSYPSEEGDGIYAGRIEVASNNSSGLLNWDSPTSGSWYFGATAIYNGVPGKFKRITAL